MLSNKSGKAKKPYAKRYKGAPVARLFRSIPAGNMLAPKAMTKLRYADIQLRSSSVSDAGLYQYRLNGPFDPDASGTGVQPPGYDNISGMYQSYRVLWAKYKVQVLWVSGLNQISAIWTATNASAPNTLQSALSQTDAECLCAATTSAGQTVLKKYISMAKAFGVEPAEVETDSDYGSLASTVPVRQAYLNIYTGNASGTTSSTCHVVVQLTYGVEWHNPVTQNMN